MAPPNSSLPRLSSQAYPDPMVRQHDFLAPDARASPLTRPNLLACLTLRKIAPFFKKISLIHRPLLSPFLGDQ